MTTRICPLTPTRTPFWDSYVLSHPQGSPFHLTAWKRVIELTFGHQPLYMLAEEIETQKIVGVLPLFLVRSRIFGKMMISTPLAAYGGPLADSLEIQASLFQSAREIALKEQVQFLEIRSFRNSLEDPDLQKKDLYVTFRQQLINDPDKLFQNIPRKTRAEARQGINNGLEFKCNAIGIDAFYDIYSRSVRELGTPVFSRRLFSNGLKLYGDSCNIFSVHHGGLAVSAVWTLSHGTEIYPYFGGSIRAYNHLGVNNFMYWMLIKHGCENGFHVFDFGRSKKGTGSFSFKKRWGMEVSDLPYQYLLVRRKSLPDTSPLNPKFSPAIEIWKHLPLPVTNFFGPLISRHLV